MTARCRPHFPSRRELDSIFGLLKVGLVLLVTHVLKEYLANARMEPVTFLERAATLPGRLRITPEFEIVTFDSFGMLREERHDLRVSMINALRLPMRSGRVLRVAVEDAPRLVDRPLPAPGPELRGDFTGRSRRA